MRRFLQFLLIEMWIICCCFSAAVADGIGVVKSFYGEGTKLSSVYEFPDPETEKIMRFVMGFDENQIVTYGDIWNVGSFHLSDCSEEETREYISVLKHFPYLSSVDIQNCGLKEIPQELTELSIDWLNLDGNDLRDISGLEKMKNLTVLQLAANNFITDYSPLAELENLQSLTLSMFSAGDVSAIGQCKKLLSVGLTGCFERQEGGCRYHDTTYYSVPFTDASFLSELPALEQVGIYGFSDIGEEAFEQIENCTDNVEFDIEIHDGEVRDLYNDLVNGAEQSWLGEGILRGLDKKDVLDFYESKK